MCHEAAKIIVVLIWENVEMSVVAGDFGEKDQINKLIHVFLGLNKTHKTNGINFLREENQKWSDC